MRLLVTGGLGFIGSSFIRNFINTDNKIEILNIDKISNISIPEALNELKKNKSYYFEKANLINKKKILSIIKDFSPDYVLHFAAESHVDRSIVDPRNFIYSNIVGTFNLLESIREVNDKSKSNFKKFIHVSTDEVYGSIKNKKYSFSETNKYFPNSPYSSSKAASDHLVWAWFKTFNLPVIITHCSNNYGPWQYPEKFIPVIISNAIQGKNIPIYGSGKNIRDWIFVDDHIKALVLLLLKGKIGEIYNIGANQEVSNLQLAKKICSLLDKLIPKKTSYSRLISFVDDRKGHDFRYSINANKIKRHLNFKPIYNLDKGLILTIKWYLKNSPWLLNKSSGK